MILKLLTWPVEHLEIFHLFRVAIWWKPHICRNGALNLMFLEFTSTNCFEVVTVHRYTLMLFLLEQKEKVVQMNDALPVIRSTCQLKK